jgi:hypothetical protein
VTPSSFLQAALPLFGFAVKVYFNDVGAGNAVLELDRRAQRDELAVIDNGDAVAELVSLFHVVSGDEDGEVARAAQIVEHLPDGDARDRIEAGGGLVEKEDAGIVHQAAGDFNAAAHSAGERLDLRAAPFDKVNGFKDFRDVFLALMLGDRCRAWRRC